MLNPSNAVSIPITVFGGLNSELAPSDLPLGLSPDCSDVAFLPGRVFTRPALKRYTTLNTTAQIVYTHTFPKSDGTIVKMDFDSLGGIWANGVKIGSTSAGNRFYAANAFGRTFIAISDGTKGVDVPLQYDGTNLDRVSQDGPAAPPLVNNYAIPQVALVAGSYGTAVTVTSATPIDPEQVQIGDGNQDPYGGYNPPQYETYYTSLQYLTAAPHGLSVGQVVVVTGNSLYNATSAQVTAVDSATVFELGYFGQSNATGTGGSVTPQGPLLSRSANEVTANTEVAHNLRTGYKVQISGIPDQSIGTLNSIVINNELTPDVATITMATPHGLVPGDSVTITNVPNNSVTISNFSYANGIVQIQTPGPHGLRVGDYILTQIGSSGYLGPTTVTGIVSDNTFTTSTGAPGSSTGSGGQVVYIFPLSQGTPQPVTVLETPTPTTFQVAVNYADQTWTAGIVTFPWVGTFYVDSVTSATSFTYQQVGPNAVVASGSGTVTPQGQIAPGVHQCVCIFQTRAGYLTAPSPKISQSASGGQLLAISGIPIGPTNVIARILAFTLANGSRYFYLPIAPRDPSTANVIGTSTLIADNVTTSAVFDFSDEALEAGIAIGPVDIPGNNLFQQVVLGSCLGFYPYEGRLCPWGEVNKVENFLNMGFEGGVYSSAPNVPLGWNVTGTGTLTNGDYGYAWTPTGNATISQSAYQDNVGAQILEPNTQYTFRCWANGTVTATLSSTSTNFTATASVTAAFSQAQASFSVKTPLVIPPDLVLTLSGAAMDELQIIYTDNPVRLGVRASYEDNPEAFDDITGNFGPADDPNPVTGIVALDGILSLLTNGPKGNHYRVEDSTSGEPATWTIRRHGEKCGVISPWAIASFETWFCWGSDTGLRMFYGADVEKMSQEVQKLWDSINPQAKQFTVFANDPYQRRLHILAATGAANVANAWWVMDYRDLNTSQAMANSGTLRVVSSGKVITTDLTRKWSPWSPAMNYAAVLQADDGSARMVFCGGIGGTLNDAAHSATYTLNEGVIEGVDDDYGPFWDTSYYTTAFVPEVEAAQQFQLKPYRMLFTNLVENVTGIGAVQNTTLLGSLNVQGTVTRAVPISLDLARDRAFGLNSAGERMAVRIQAQPAGPQPFPSVPAGFAVSSMVISAEQHPFSIVTGWNKVA